MVDQCIIDAEGSAPLTDLYGISVLERLVRTLDRCQFSQATILSPTPHLIERQLPPISQFRRNLRLTICSRPEGPLTTNQILAAWPHQTDYAMILRGDTIFDHRLLRALCAQAQATALVDLNIPVSFQSLTAGATNILTGKFCGAALVHRDWVAARQAPYEKAICAGIAAHDIIPLDVAAQPAYSSELRRALRPIWFPAPSPANKGSAEQKILKAAQKGTPDFPAWVHAPIENFLISKLAHTSVTPNQLSVFCNIVAWTVTVLFATGHLVPGMVLALIVGILDGLDGKQARVKVETSKTGKLEHWFDTAFEISWWTALAWYFYSSGRLPSAFHYLLLLFCAEAIDAVAKGSVLLTYGKLIDEFGRFDRLVRWVGGRRNIYVWILAIGIALGAAPAAFITMAWLEVATAAVHVVRAAWIRFRLRRGSVPTG